MSKFLKILKRCRNSKIKKLSIFILSIIIFILVYKSQELWIFKNCSTIDPSPSCKYSWQRLYLLPFFIFFFFYMLIYIDKILIYIKNLDTFLDSLSAKKMFVLNAILVCFISCIFFNIKFSFAIINPKNINWLIIDGGDLSQHYMGWFVFLNSPWEFPLGIIKKLNYPIGTSVGYADPIPLLAFIFKFFIHKINEGFQYSGLWLFSCYFLQAYFSSLIVKNWDCKFIFKFISSILIAITPVFLNRYGHLALDSHWVILASFCIYQSHNLMPNYKLYLHSLLLFFTAWIHPYITLMIFVLHCAVLGKLFLENKYKLNTLIFNFIINSVAIILSWYMIGYFYIGGRNGTQIGYFSANLNAFFNPLVNNSQFLLPLSNWGGQYEGFAYLGAGLILLFIFVIFENWDKKSHIFIKKNFPLLAAIFVLILYALSNDIRFGAVTILKYPIPNSIMDVLGIFQSSGRFIWPLYYFVIISILYLWIKRERNNYKKSIFLIIILIVQFTDIYPMYKSLNYIYGEKFVGNIDVTKWTNIMGTTKDKILFYPAYKPSVYSTNDYINFWYLSAKYNYSVNIGYFSRHDHQLEKENEDIILSQIKTGNLLYDSIYVTKKEDANLFEYALNQKLIKCDGIDNYFVCQKKN